MHLNKEGTVLISTMLILALISTIGAFFFKMMKNNNELSYITNLDEDIYDLRENENEALKNFMKKLESLKNSNELDKKSLLEAIPKIVVEYNEKASHIVFQYNEEKNELILITYVDKELTTNGDNLEREKVQRQRNIKIVCNKERILLVPTCDFIDVEE